MTQYFPSTSAALTAPGIVSLDTSQLPMATAIIQATGNGSGLTFNAQGIPLGGSTAVTLPMYPLASGVIGSPVASASANGCFIVPCAGFVSVQVDLTVIGGGTETFSIGASPAGWATP